jgi:hypothetical protein
VPRSATHSSADSEAPSGLTSEASSFNSAVGAAAPAAAFSDPYEAGRDCRRRGRIWPETLAELGLREGSAAAREAERGWDDEHRALCRGEVA